MTLREVLETKATGLIPKFRAWFDSEMYDMPIICDGDLYLDYSDFLNGDMCNSATIMKSTGKFDNSTPKKEIFEGDVLRDSESIVIVKFADGAFSVDYRNMGGEWRSYGSLFRYLKDYEGEIIGNVFEHNHLLK